MRMTYGGKHVSCWFDEMTSSLVDYKVEKVFEFTKSPYELYINPKLKGAVMGMGFLFDKAEITLVKSKKYEGCFRMRPALTEEQARMVENYLNTFLEV
jgi:hypothetical protein